MEELAVMRRVPMILQSEAPECGIACVAMIASYHGFRTDLAAMRLRLAPSMKGVTLKHISAIAETMGMAARGVKVPLESLSQLKLPAILHWDMNHFVVLTQVNGDTITVQRSGARPARAAARRSLGSLHRRRDGDDAERPGSRGATSARRSARGSWCAPPPG